MQVALSSSDSHVKLNQWPIDDCFFFLSTSNVILEAPLVEVCVSILLGLGFMAFVQIHLSWIKGLYDKQTSCRFLIDSFQLGPLAYLGLLILFVVSIIQQ